MGILTVLLVGPSACGRSCGCVEGSKTYETLDGKVRVSLVRNVHWTGGKIPGPLTSFALHVATTPPIDAPVDCDHVDMAEDDAGKLVAFRCRDEKPWTVLRLRGGDRYLRECEAPVGTDRKPDFSKLRPVSEVATRILRCPHMGAGYANEQIVRATIEDEGIDVASRLVGLTLADQGLVSSGDKDPWAVGLSALGDEGKGRALEPLCGALEGGSPTPARYVRAATRCALGKASAGPPAIAMFSALSASPAEVGWSDIPVPLDRAFLWSALIASELLAADAGSVACRVAASPPQSKPRRAIIAATLARTRTKCPAFVAWLTPPPCSKELDCDGGLCSATELVADDDWSEAFKRAGERGDPTIPNLDRALLRAVYVDAAPASLILANSRRRYPMVAAGPSCDTATLEAGAPCSCPEFGDWERCRAEVVAGRTRYRYCSLRVDDTKRQISDVRRVCEGPGSACDFSSRLCCDGLRCRELDGGPPGVCDVVASPDASAVRDR